MISYLYGMTTIGFLAAANLSWLLYRAISPTSPRLAKTSSTIYVTFGGNKASRQRLDGTGHEFYLGLPYFNSETRERLLKIPTKNGTLETDLRQLAVKRSGGDICAAHDLSPLYEAILGVQWDRLKEKGTALHDQMSSS